MAQSDPYRELERVERRFLAEELERRIAEYEAIEDDSFGRFTIRDWVVCVLFGLLLPALALIWAAP